jgi:transposase
VPCKRRQAKFEVVSARAAAKIREFLESSTQPIQLPALRTFLIEEGRFRISTSTLRSFLRERLGLRYVRLGIVSPLYNTPELRILRQIAAEQYIQILEEGKVLINVDESVLRATDHRTRGWNPFGRRTFSSHSQRLFSVNIIAAITTRGQVLFTVNRGRTRSSTFCLFLAKLASHLDIENPQWRANSILLIDNAPYHRSKETREFLARAQIPLMFLGPYQFAMAPVEKLFAFIKGRDLNPLMRRAYSK